LSSSTSTPIQTLGEHLRDRLLSAASTPESNSPDELALRALADNAIALLESCSDWDASVSDLVVPIVEALAMAPERRAPVFDIASRRLRIGFSKSHNARATGTTTRNRAGETVFMTETGIPRAIARQLLERIPTGERIPFLESVNSWPVLTTIAAALPDLRLEGEEFVAFARTASVLAKGDAGSAPVYEAVRSWASRHQETARQIVEARLTAAEWACHLTLEILQLVVESVIASKPPDWEPWRNDVLRRLREDRNEESWCLATYLACFAWPEPPPPAQERLAALLDDVRRIPRRLGGVGLAATARFALRDPVEALRTAHEIYRLAQEYPEPPPIEFDTAFANTAFMAMGNAKRAGRSPQDLRFASDDLIGVAPGRADLLIDSFLQELRTSDPEAVHDFLRRWLSRHSIALRQGGAPLEHSLHLTMTALEPETRAEWYLRWIASPDKGLRTAASELFERADPPPEIGSAALKGFSTREMEGLVHQLVGGLAVMGGIWIPALLDIAELRDDVSSLIREILVEEAVLDFPGVSKREFESRLARDTSRNVKEMLTAMRRRWTELEAFHSQKVAIPELLALRPATEAWAKAFHRRTVAARDEAMSRSPLLDAISMMPVGRGDSFDPGTPGSVPTGFKRFSAEFESPSRHEMDHLAWEIARRKHLLAASALLDGTEPTNA
jgi:hypothetical protein